MNRYVSYAEYRRARSSLRLATSTGRMVGLGFLVFWLLLLSCSAVAHCQTRPPVTRVRLTREAAAFVDSLAIEAREQRHETAGCATSYVVRDSVLTIERFAPARYDSTDSVHIFAAAPLCGPGVPTIHSHVADGGYGPSVGPSETDRYTSAATGIWALLLIVWGNGYAVGVYP